MPFSIENSGVVAAASQATAVPGGKIRTRTWTGVVEPQVAEPHDTRSCGRDAVINKPYKPLGAMDSVLGLHITYRRDADLGNGDGLGEDRSKLARRVGALRLPDDGKRRHTSNQASGEHGKSSAGQDSDSKVAGQHIAAAKASEQLALVSAADDPEPFGKAIWKLRHEQRKQRGTDATTSIGFREIQKQLRDANERIKTVKTGASSNAFYDRKSPIECANWAKDRAERKLKNQGLHKAFEESHFHDAEARGKGLGVPRKGFETSETRRASVTSISFSGTPTAPASERHRHVGDHGRRQRTVQRLREGLLALEERNKSEARQHTLPHHELIRQLRQEQQNLVPETCEKSFRGNDKSRRGHRSRKLSQESRCGSSAAAAAANSFKKPGRTKPAASDSATPSLDTEEKQEKRPSASQPAIPGANPLTEKQRKRLPSYVIHFPRKSTVVFGRPSAAGMNAASASAAAVAAAVAAASSGVSSDTDGGILDLKEDGAAEAENAGTGATTHELHPKTSRMLRLERQHKQILSKIERAVAMSRAMQRGLLQESQDFATVTNELEGRLHERISAADFARGSRFRSKFLALNMALTECSTSAEFSKDAEKQLQLMRMTTKELQSIKDEYNLNNSVWFQTLMSRIKESKQTVSPAEKKVLAVFRQLIIEGHILTPELFKSILVDVIDREDQKLGPVQRLLGIVRDNVLKMDLSSFLDFLRAHSLPIPKSLLQKIEQETKARRRNNGGGGGGGGLVAGVRAAAMAMKWKRRTNILVPST